jgi:uncharacterized protein (DUF1810 family)
VSDSVNLQRFVHAQASVYDQVCLELRDGRKKTHWMWFIFPQLSGLGHSWMAKKYAIGSLVEAKAYLEHPHLGERLRECTGLVCTHRGAPISRIFGHPDDLKFHSSMTLFARVAQANSIFFDALAYYFDGIPDTNTVHVLSSPSTEDR